LGNAHSVEWYHTNNPSGLYMTSCHKFYSFNCWNNSIMYEKFCP
jgi:hypothetical protein